MNKSIIKQLVPPLLLNTARGLLQKPIFSGRYTSFEEASHHCRGGYEVDAVIDSYAASYQALMAEPAGELLHGDYAGRFAHLMSAISLALAEGDGRTIRVLDFGGSYGAYYEVARHLYPNIHIEWDIIETGRVVEEAHRLGASETKRFYSNIDAIKSRKYDLCFASSSLQYTPFPLQTLNDLLSLNCSLYLITRFPLARFLDEDVVMVQNVPIAIYEASYPVWFFSPRWFDHFKERRCAILLQTDVPMDMFNVDGHVFPNVMFILRKTA